MEAEAAAHTASHLLDLPIECVVSILRDTRLVDILRFSEASDSAHALAGDGQLWEPLFRARHWTGGPQSAQPPEKPNEPGAWRVAYRRAARTESPVVLQISEFRSLAGFARDTSPLPTACIQSEVSIRVDDALAAIGLYQSAAAGVQTPLRGADVILVLGPLDGLSPTAPFDRRGAGATSKL